MTTSPDTGPVREADWRCFHCDEHFTDHKAAAEHFGNGNYEGETPICIEAATSDLKTLVATNRSMWERIDKLDRDLEQCEFERDCWSQAARKAIGDPYASWHDIRGIREDADNEIAAAKAPLNAAPRWLQRLLRWKAERDWKRHRRAMDKLCREAKAIEAAALKGPSQ